MENGKRKPGKPRNGRLWLFSSLDMSFSNNLSNGLGPGHCVISHPPSGHQVMIADQEYVCPEADSLGQVVGEEEPGT